MRDDRHLIDTATGRVVVPRLLETETAIERCVGLLGRHQLEDDQGMLLHRCSSIHTCFMHMTIDVIFLDDMFEVVEVVPRLRPFRLRWKPGAAMTLEMAAGAAERAGMLKGMKLLPMPRENGDPVR